MLRLVPLVLLSMACAQPRLARRDVGTSRATQQDVFETGYHHEAILYPYQHVLDEATLLSVPPSVACIALTLRDVYDNPLADFDPIIVIDGERLRPTIAGGLAERGACMADVCMTTRRARLCAAVPPTLRGDRIELRMVHPYLVYRSDVTGRRTRYELVFTWWLAD
ncbi:MAG TPA: hypothetical protein VIV11_34485 [Kofleriaceae bacterium]